MKTLTPFLLSIFFPGLGQLYLHDYLRGILMLSLSIGTVFILPLFISQYFVIGTIIWSLADIYLKTEKTHGKSKALKNLIFSVIVVIIILPLVFYLTIVSFSIGGKYVTDHVLNEKHTRNEMVKISTELDKHYYKTGKYPVDFEMFIRKKPVWSNWINDSWGNKYEYTISGPNSFTLTSAGKDGKFGTDDDLIKANKRH